MFAGNHIQYGPITKDHRAVAIAIDSWRHVPRYKYVAKCGAESLWRVISSKAMPVTEKSISQLRMKTRENMSWQ